MDQNTGATFHASDIMGFKKTKSSNVPSDGNPAVSVAQPASAVDAEQGSQLVTTGLGFLLVGFDATLPLYGVFLK